MHSPSAAHSRALLLVAVALPCYTVRADEVNGLRSSVAPVGDLDGDGVPDFALAQRGPGPAGFLEVVFNHELVLVRILSGRDGDLIRTLHPPTKCYDFGRAMADVGDVDGDGARDLAIAGGEHVWVFSGTDGHVIHELGLEAAARGFGDGLAGGGDADGDGVPDIAVFRRSSEPGVTSLALLYSGRSGALIRALGCHAVARRPRLPEALYAQVSGAALTGAIALVPDRTGDGRAELALSVGGVKLGEAEEHVEALIVLDTVDARILQASALPERQSGGTPWVIRALGDLDGDGTPELAVSLVHDYLVVYRGGSGEELRRHSFVGGYMNAEGTSLDVIGDVNGDGVADYLLGANEDSLDCDPGFAIVYSGRDGQLLRSFRSPYHDGNCGAGMDVCTLGDANGDGIDDVVVHMPRLKEARVLSGADFSVLMRLDTAKLAADEPSKR